ncbi:MAG: hypothetical protein ABI666_07510 [Ferruginibacter sp.]
MKKFKTIDMWISIALITGFGIASIINHDYTFIIGYFAVGGWQVISMIVHAVDKWFTEKRGARYIYHWITFISVITMPIGSFWILLFTAPFMAVYYTWLCYNEVYVKMQRPLAQLK